MNRVERLRWLKELKPYWDKREKLLTKFYKKETKLEKKMNKKLSLDCELEFFHCDGVVVGIGAVNYKDRPNKDNPNRGFPLIHDHELDTGEVEDEE